MTAAAPEITARFKAVRSNGKAPASTILYEKRKAFPRASSQTSVYNLWVIAGSQSRSFFKGTGKCILLLQTLNVRWVGRRGMGMGVVSASQAWLSCPPLELWWTLLSHSHMGWNWWKKTGCSQREREMDSREAGKKVALCNLYPLAFTICQVTPKLSGFKQAFTISH